MKELFRKLGEMFMELGREPEPATSLRNETFQALRGIERFAQIAERVIARLEAHTDALLNPSILTGVEIHATVEKPKHEDQGKVWTRMGGHSALLKAGQEARFTFDPYMPLEKFELRTWGGCVITDVLVGNQSFLLTHGGTGVAEGRFDVSVNVGSRISVLVKVPAE